MTGTRACTVRVVGSGESRTATVFGPQSAGACKLGTVSISIV